MPSARADARPFAFKPPLGLLPSARCQAGVFIQENPQIHPEPNHLASITQELNHTPNPTLQRLTNHPGRPTTTHQRRLAGEG